MFLAARHDRGCRHRTPARVVPVARVVLAVAPECPVLHDLPHSVRPVRLVAHVPRPVRGRVVVLAVPRRAVPKVVVDPVAVLVLVVPVARR